MYIGHKDIEYIDFEPRKLKTNGLRYDIMTRDIGQHSVSWSESKNKSWATRVDGLKTSAA